MSNENQNPTMEQAMVDNKPVVVPMNVYKLRVQDCKFGESKSSKKPMYTLECELVDNPPIVIDGKPVDVNGLTTFKYASLTPEAFGNLGQLHKSMGLPTNLTFTEVAANPNPNLYIGRTFRALCGSKAKPVINEVTGTPVLHPDTQQPIINYSLEIKQVI